MQKEYGGRNQDYTRFASAKLPNSLKLFVSYLNIYYIRESLSAEYN